MFDVLEAQKRRPAMKKISTMQAFSNEILKEQKLTIGVDLGDRWSFYCVLDEAGKVILEQKVATTPQAMKPTFGKIPRSLIALETGTHSPWVSRLLTELGHQVLVRLCGAQGYLPIRTELFDQNTSHWSVSRVVHTASQRDNRLHVSVLDYRAALSMQTGRQGNEKAANNPEDSRNHGLSYSVLYGRGVIALART
jgi:hypothetical protein